MKISVYLYMDGIAIHYFDGRQTVNLVHTIKKIRFPSFMKKSVCNLAKKYKGLHPDFDVIDSTILRLKQDL